MGTQVLLQNPVCLIAFAVLVSFRSLLPGCSGTHVLCGPAVVLLEISKLCRGVNHASLPGVQCWMFFKRRIAIEEAQLRLVFGAAYIRYQQQVPTLLPFIL